MKKIILLLSVFVLTLSSCSKSDITEGNQTSAPTPTPTPHSPLIKKARYRFDVDTVNTYPNYNYIYFGYNGNKLVRTYKYEYNPLVEGSLFTYTGNLITKIESYRYGSTTNVSTFEYNSEQKLVKYSFHDTGSHNGEVFNYINNSDGTISYEKYIWHNFDSTAQYLMERGKIYNDRCEIIGFSPTGQTCSFKFIKDGKINPLNNIMGYDKICMVDIICESNVINFMRLNGDCTQNVTSVSINRVGVDAPGVFNPIPKPFSKFTYDNNNYPIKQHYVKVDNPIPMGDGENVTFDYYY